MVPYLGPYYLQPVNSVFNCEFNLLNAVHENFVGTGKSVDSGCPLLPVKLPRGYGGVGIMWQKKLDHLVTPKEDGNERIQCVEISTAPRPILLVSVYMPCRDHKADNVLEFIDCTVQLNTIYQKYKSTHDILIGGDINEDISVRNSDRRNRVFQNFVIDNELKITDLGKTFLNTDGIEVSKIDYFLYGDSMADLSLDFFKMDSCRASLSDHYPLRCTFECRYTLKSVPGPSRRVTTRINWDRVDKQVYQEKVSAELGKLAISDTLDETIDNINTVIKVATDLVVPPRQAKRSAPKLKIASSSMKEASAKNKRVFWEWKKSGKPRETDNVLYMAVKSSKRDLRRECRKSLATKRNDYKQEILDSRDRNSKVFHRLISNQKGKSTNIMTELTVSQKTFKTEQEILEGWKIHFSKLAEKSDPEGFDREYIGLVDKDLGDIIDICKWQQKERVILSISEIEKAIRSLNKGKAPDINGLTVEHILYGGQELLEKVATVIQQIFDHEYVPDSLKQGILTPVYSPFLHYPLVPSFKKINIGNTGNH